MTKHDIRRCPICKREIKYSEYRQVNEKILDIHKRISIWNNEKITILCCYCWEIIKYIKRHPEMNINVDIYNEESSWSVNRDYKNGGYYIFLNFHLYYNMRMMGLIDNGI